MGWRIWIVGLVVRIDGCTAQEEEEDAGVRRHGEVYGVYEIRDVHGVLYRTQYRRRSGRRWNVREEDIIISRVPSYKL